VLVLLFFGLVLLVLGITLIPILIEQINELGNRLPDWINSGTQQLDTFEAWANARRLPVNLNRWIVQLEDQVANQLQTASGAVVGTLVSAIGSLLNVMLTLVLTFYLLLQGQQVWSGIFRYAPLTWGPRLRESLRQNFHNYFCRSGYPGPADGVGHDPGLYDYSSSLWSGVWPGSRGDGAVPLRSGPGHRPGEFFGGLEQLLAGGQGGGGGHYH
jgi:hypothetical protein